MSLLKHFMKLNQVLFTIAVAFFSAIAGVVVYEKVVSRSPVVVEQAREAAPVFYSKYFRAGDPVGELTDFTKAAASAVPAVVHIKTKISFKKGKGRDDSDDPFGSGLWPYLMPEQRASGSGVIVSDDGYIVTNNHVVSDGAGGVAQEINVTLSNGKSFKAAVIGRSEVDDIAVLKIEATKLPYMLFGNSDLLQTGQWVLAVGYPLTLEATVTAGIVSATGRNIGLRGRPAKNGEESRSYIQTDAAVNSGNSGGALIDTDGNLIGINAAIMSPTGTYAGYSFAVPVNIVKNAVKKIIQAGAFN